MPRIIKYDDDSAHSYSDFERETLQDYVPGSAVTEAEAEPELTAEEQAQQVLADARAAAEQKIREGYEQGFQRGEEAGRKAIMEEAGGAAQALQAAAEAIGQARGEFLEQLQGQLVQLTQALTERVLHREASTRVEVVQAAAASALEHLAKQERTVLRLNPRDLDALESAGLSLPGHAEGFDLVEVQADESVEPGGCVAETKALRVDATLTTQLHRLIDAMLE